MSQETVVHLHNHTAPWSDVEREIRRLWRDPVPVSRPVERWADAQAPIWDDFTRPAPEAFIASAERHQAPLTQAQSRRLWDGLTDAITEQRDRQAARPSRTVPVNAKVGREPKRVRAIDRASFDAWQRDEYATPSKAWSDALWNELTDRLTERQNLTRKLLVGELPVADLLTSAPAER